MSNAQASWSGSTASTSVACAAPRERSGSSPRIDVFSSFAWAELVICKQGNPTALHASRLARRVADALKAAGWRLERLLSDNGNEFRGPAFRDLLERRAIRHTRIHAGRPQTNGHVEAYKEDDYRNRVGSYYGPGGTGYTAWQRSAGPPRTPSRPRHDGALRDDREQGAPTIRSVPVHGRRGCSTISPRPAD
jgi:transposase InsO family protein